MMDDPSNPPLPDDPEFPSAPVHDADGRERPERADARQDKAANIEATVADGVFRPLDPRFIPAERVGWWITVVVLGLPLAVFAALQGVFGWIEGIAGWGVLGGAIVLIGLLVLLAVRLPVWTYRNTSFAVSPLGMEIRRGILFKHVIDVPRSRIQHTDVAQGPLQRRFGIATITLHTAGTSNASVPLGGMNYHHALLVRDYLIQGSAEDGV